jgi:hypothetical protein
MRSRYRRPRPNPPNLLATWVSLGFLVLTLVMLLLMRERLADSAAGCFTRISEPAEEESIVVPEAQEGAAGNVQVLVPERDVEPAERKDAQ